MSAEHRIALVSSTLSSPCWSELCTQEHGAVIASLLEVITLRPPTSGLGTSHAHLLETHWIRPRANEQCTNASILFLISHFNLANLKSRSSSYQQPILITLNSIRGYHIFFIAPINQISAQIKVFFWYSMNLCQTWNLLVSPSTIESSAVNIISTNDSIKVLKLSKQNFIPRT